MGDRLRPAAIITVRDMTPPLTLRYDATVTNLVDRIKV